MRVIRPPALFELRAHGLPSRSSPTAGIARLRTACFDVAAFARSRVAREGWRNAVDSHHTPEGRALVSTEARLARPVDIPKWSAWQDLHLQPFRLERNASALGYVVLRLKSMNWCRAKDSHPQPPRSEQGASASWANAAKMALPAGISPATSAFEARRSDN